jgi:hypothetical protein
MQQGQLLRQIVLDSRHLVDEEPLAEALIARVRTARLIWEAGPSRDAGGSQARSWRPCTEARWLARLEEQVRGDGRVGGDRRRRS